MKKIIQWLTASIALLKVVTSASLPITSQEMNGATRALLSPDAPKRNKTFDIT